MIYLILFLISYIIGSIPSAFLIGKKVRGIDISDHGSGNVGATNVLRVLGKKWGALVLGIDVFKGILAVLIAKIVLDDYHGLYLNWVFLGVGGGAFLGHLFPCWLKFKGGKGVAVAAGVFLVLAPIEVLIALFIFIIVTSITKYVSLGSMVSAFILPVMISLNFSGNKWVEQLPYLIASSIICVLVIFMHRKNIVRLLKGNEDKVFSANKGL